MNELLREDLKECLQRTRPLWEELRGKSIFLTGATGFFGAWLLETLFYANRELALQLRATILTRNPESFRQALPHLAAEPSLTILAGDVRSFDFPTGDFDYVIHAATDASAKLSAEDPTLMFDTIVEGTRRVLEFARQAGTRKVLFLSSGAVYGMQPPEVSHLAEDAVSGPEPLNVASCYAEGKRAAELLCALTAHTSAIEIKIARCYAFAGPYMKLDAHFAIGNFIRDSLRGGAIRMAGDGRAVRSYMYGGELMVWLWTILFRGQSLRAYNVGSEEAVTIAELARAVSETLEPKAAVEILGQPGTAPAHRYVPSTARAQKELGLQCRVSLRESIRRTARWARTTADEGKEVQ
ncbi:MAG: NAD(P)-dependent oxidoreductase [Acidobacteriota bacterium]|nr:NAD(P)-dependent oxidoreductase [Acidobacteriota bacterium]